MIRRDFLKYTSLAAAALLLPTPAKAETSYDGPLWFFIHASGGWDPTSLCDPKGREKTVMKNGSPSPMNRTYGQADIKTATNSTIRYAPLTGRGYAFETFFEKYGKDLLVLNGIDCQTNGHSDGTRYQFSGHLSQTYPSIAALIAGIKMPQSPLSFLTYGGYDFTDGLVPATRVSNTGVIGKLALPNQLSASSSSTYQSASTLSRILEAKAAREEVISGRQSIGSVRNAISQYMQAHSNASDLQKVLNYFDTAELNPTPSTAMGRNARFAMAAFKAGLTVSVNMRSGGFDTHGNHDNSVTSGNADDITGDHNNDHIGRMGDLLKGVDEIMQEASLQGISDRVVIVIGSDFGRTPGYNGGNGKDHWPVGSMMLMGSGINSSGSGKVIGASSDSHAPKSLDLQTLTVDEANGSTITYAHINKALRKLAGIDAHPLIQQHYQINAEDLPLFA